MNFRKRVINVEFPEPVVVRGKDFWDYRGSFVPFVPLSETKQISVSTSNPYVIRGMHWQINRPQTKVLSCVEGSIHDVCLDLRQLSPNFGAIYEFDLGNNRNEQLIIPKGFAHGFQAQGSKAVVIYMIDSEYDPSDECGFRFDSIPVDWKIPMNDSCFLSEHVSEKDSKWPKIGELTPEMFPKNYR